MKEDLLSTVSDELWLCHLSCLAWTDTDRWLYYFRKVEEVFGAKISHLDSNDPVRRRVGSGGLPQVAGYLTSFGKQEESRWVFGRIESLDIEFSVQHYRDADKWPNSIDWYFPNGYSNNLLEANVARKLFDIGNDILAPFYSYSDLMTHVSSKKKSLGAVDLQAELIGVFWLTFFSDKYVYFIGKENFDKIAYLGTNVSNGTTIDLGATPSTVPVSLRTQVEQILAPKLFVNPSDHIGKRPGEFALTFKQLR